jgi:hypothetical protein
VGCKVRARAGAGLTRRGAGEAIADIDVTLKQVRCVRQRGGGGEGGYDCPHPKVGAGGVWYWSHGGGTAPTSVLRFVFHAQSIPPPARPARHWPFSRLGGDLRGVHLIQQAFSLSTPHLIDYCFWPNERQQLRLPLTSTAFMPTNSPAAWVIACINVPAPQTEGCSSGRSVTLYSNGDEVGCVMLGTHMLSATIW